MSDVPGDTVVNAGWQGQVEEAVSFCATRQRQQVTIEVGEGTLIIILSTYVRVAAEEGSETVHFSVCHLRSGIQRSFNIYAQFWPPLCIHKYTQAHACTRTHTYGIDYLHVGQTGFADGIHSQVRAGKADKERLLRK